MSQGLETGSKCYFKRPKEQITFVAWGFFQANIFAQISGSASKVLFAIASLTNVQRNTSATNEELAKWSGVNLNTVKNSLRELEYYHFIERHNTPKSTRIKRKRIITLQRWDTAKEKLEMDNKAILDDAGKVKIICPNPFRK